MNKLIRTFYLIIFTFIASINIATAQAVETGFINRTLSLDGVDYRYQVYVPPNYDDSDSWPVILFLHGAGSKGDDGIKQTEDGLGSAIRRFSERYPAITVFPQAPVGGTWQGLPAEAALAALDSSLEEFNTDHSRIYLTGLSMGGNGSWYVAFHQPERFAALVVICGFVTDFTSPTSGVKYSRISDDVSLNPFNEVADKVKELPIWIFHGDADPLVSVEESRNMAVALEALGADMRYTELEGVGHNAWDSAYRSEEFANWLFQQQLP